jgi:transposase-like protein
MKRRIWTSKQKAQIVLEGLSGQIDVSHICPKYQVSQTQYYKWRDTLPQNCYQSFEVKKQTVKEHF